jgi:hypothetical protein
MSHQPLVLWLAGIFPFYVRSQEIGPLPIPTHSTTSLVNYSKFCFAVLLFINSTSSISNFQLLQILPRRAQGFDPFAALAYQRFQPVQ